jgi:hypothetical protein
VHSPGHVLAPTHSRFKRSTLRTLLACLLMMVMIVLPLLADPGDILKLSEANNKPENWRRLGCSDLYSVIREVRGFVGIRGYCISRHAIVLEYNLYEAILQWTASSKAAFSEKFTVCAHFEQPSRAFLSSS